MGESNIKVFNDDVAGIFRRINKFIEEAQKCASSNVSDINEFDKVRFLAYLKSLTAYVDWVVDQPLLDLPETHPKLLELEEIPVVLLAENLMIRDLVRLFERARDEVINSQSARNATGLISFDETRVRAVVEKATKYIENYVTKVTPIDLPESSPKNVSTGAGRTGINA